MLISECQQITDSQKQSLRLSDSVKLIVGVSLQVSAPLGQYANSKLLNLGNNRWSFRPELGVSKAWGPWTVEVAPSSLSD